MKNDVLMYFDLIMSIKTTKEADNLSSEIDTLRTSLSGSQKSLDEAMRSISIGTCKKVEEIFAKNNLDMTDSELVRNFLDTLFDLIKKFKIIKLILAFDPSERTIEKIHDFIKENIGVGYILDIEISESIIGGAVVMFNGKYADFTLKKSLEEVFANKKRLSDLSNLGNLRNL